MVYQGLEIDDISFTQAENILTQMVTMSNTSASELSNQAKRTQSLVGIIAILGMLGGTLLALTFGFLLSISITRSMNSAVARLGKGASEVTTASHQLAASAGHYRKAVLSKLRRLRRLHQHYKKQVR
jgi:hypothetical protein